MHIPDEDLKSYVFGRLAEGRSCTVACHLAGCETCEIRFAEAVRFARQVTAIGQDVEGSQERRRDHRFPTNEGASMQPLVPLSIERSRVRILDVSRNGMKLASPVFLQPGTVVQVRTEGSVALGEVRYCLLVRTEFQIGVRLDEVLPR